jgi:hypothetical protein
MFSVADIFANEETEHGLTLFRQDDTLWLKSIKQEIIH